MIIKATFRGFSSRSVYVTGKSYELKIKGATIRLNGSEKGYVHYKSIHEFFCDWEKVFIIRE